MRMYTYDSLRFRMPDGWEPIVATMGSLIDGIFCDAGEAGDLQYAMLTVREPGKQRLQFEVGCCADIVTYKSLYHGPNRVEATEAFLAAIGGGD